MRPGISNEDRLLIRAVDEAREEPGYRIDLSDVAQDDDIDDPLPVATAWAAAGYGTHQQMKTDLGVRYLAFTFSGEGYARAKAEADRLRKAYPLRRRWKWPEFDGTSIWVAIGFALIALIYHLLIGE